MKISERTISLEYIIPENPDRLWERWTTREGLLSFFGRDNRIDITPGGPFEIHFLLDNPPGLRGSEGCRVLSFLPGKMLSFSWNAPPQFSDVRESDYKTWVVILFEANGKGSTRLCLSHLGWPEDSLWDEVYLYFGQAWKRVMDSLLDAVKGKEEEHE